MTHCINCGRRLKAPTPTGMGSTCARKAKAVPVPDHDRDLFGYDIERAIQAARYRLSVFIGSAVVEAHIAVRRGFRDARERVGLTP